MPSAVSSKIDELSKAVYDLAPPGFTISVSGSIFSPWVLGAGAGVELVWIKGYGWVSYIQGGPGVGFPGGGVAIEVGPIGNIKAPGDYERWFLELQAGGGAGAISFFGWPEGAGGAKGGVYMGLPGGGLLVEYYTVFHDYTKDE